MLKTVHNLCGIEDGLAACLCLRIPGGVTGTGKTETDAATLCVSLLRAELALAVPLVISFSPFEIASLTGLTDPDCLSGEEVAADKALLVSRGAVEAARSVSQPVSQSARVTYSLIDITNTITLL